MKNVMSNVITISKSITIEENWLKQLSLKGNIPDDIPDLYPYRYVMKKHYTTYINILIKV